MMISVEHWNATLEIAAKACEHKIVGGRAWTEDQSIAAGVLESTAKDIRGLKVPGYLHNLGVEIWISK